MRCHSVFSTHSPVLLSFRRSVVAMLNRAMAKPLPVNFSSASRPRLPTRIALLTLPIR